jgi:hypothetical protein
MVIIFHHEHDKDNNQIYGCRKTYPHLPCKERKEKSALSERRDVESLRVLLEELTGSTDARKGGGA